MLSSFLLFSSSSRFRWPVLQYVCREATLASELSPPDHWGGDVSAGETSILGCRAHCHPGAIHSAVPPSGACGDRFTISSFDAILHHLILASRQPVLRWDPSCFFERSMNRSTRCRLDQRIAGGLGLAVLYSRDRQIIIFEGLWFLV